MSNKKAVLPRCPLRPDDSCSLCWPGANGPHDCGLVYLVMDDPETRELYIADRKKRAERKRAEKENPSE